MTGNVQGTDYIIVHAIIIANINSLPGMTIAWNQIINQPGNSRVEDNINIYESSGTLSSPILIHDNYIFGGYNIDPTNTGTGWGYTGGGILLGDGTATDTAATAAAFVNAYNNIVVSTTNYGIAIAAGHDNTIYDNTIISSGLLSNGQTIADQNVGVYIWNSYGQPNTVFFNNSGYGNLVGWVNPNDSGGRNDWWTPNATSWTNNTDYSGTDTLATEAAEWTFWQNEPATNQTSVSATPAVTADTPVNLGSPFNLDGIVNDGSTFSLTTGIIDGGAAALSANLLGTSQTWNGTPFTIGAAGSSNVVSATGQTISLPAGQYASLQFLGLAVNGNQANQTFTVNYADGTTQTFTQSLSDWFSPQNYTGESTAVTMAYRDLSNGTKDNRTFYVYGYSFSLNATKTVSSITLPNDANVKLLSVTLSTA